MLTEDQLIQILASGESDAVEFKGGSTPLPVLLTVLCSFANRLIDDEEPAHLIIGVDDHGIPQTDTIDRDVAGEIRAAVGEALHPAPSLDFRRFSLQGRPVWAISVVPSSEGLVKLHGLVYVRAGAHSRLASADDLRVLEVRRTLQKPTRCYVQQIALKNYRLFKEVTLSDIPQSLLVLVAQNGCGKTALLDALSLPMQSLVSELLDQPERWRFTSDDVHRSLSHDQTMEIQLPARVQVQLQINRQVESTSYEMTSATPNSWGAIHDDEQIRSYARALRSALATPSPGGAEDLIFPVIAHYGTGRLFAPQQDQPTMVADTSRLSGYLGCLSPTSNFRAFIDWFERYAKDAQQAAQQEQASPHRSGERLLAVQRAVDVVLRDSGWHTLHWDFPQGALAATHPQHGRLPVAWLSDGLKSVVALVGDLAHRCVRLNPILGAAAARRTPGIVLIDEVELHLHPGWQQTILPSLGEAFPFIQFIVTTHSDQVLSTVDASSIRVLSAHDGVGLADTPQWQTRGDNSTAVLAAVMGVAATPDVAEARLLSDYHGLIQAGAADSTEALALRRRLEAHFGPTHRLLTDCDRLIRFAALRRRHSAASGGA